MSPWNVEHDDRDEAVLTSVESPFRAGFDRGLESLNQSRPST
jgi:hypothetical protein